MNLLQKKMTLISYENYFCRKNTVQCDLLDKNKINAVNLLENALPCLAFLCEQGAEFLL